MDNHKFREAISLSCRNQCQIVHKQETMTQELFEYYCEQLSQAGEEEIFEHFIAAYP